MQVRTAAGGSGDVRAPTLDFIDSTGRLRSLLVSFYLYRDDSPLVEGVERVDVGQIRFLLRGEGEMRFADGRTEPALPIMIQGPGTAAATYRVRGPFHCFGISLRPVGWRSLIGVPAHQAADRILDGRRLFCRKAGTLLERLRTMETLAEMTAAVEPLLFDRRRETRPAPAAHITLARLVREWTASGAPRIDALFEAAEQEAGLGRRQVTRLCNEYFGGPPKLLERKYRAIGAAMRIFQGEDPATVVGRFADQSHMINEIKRFTGHTPTALRNGIDPVLAQTLASETFHILPEVIPETVDADA